MSSNTSNRQLLQTLNVGVLPPRYRSVKWTGKRSGSSVGEANSASSHRESLSPYPVPWILYPQTIRTSSATGLRQHPKEICHMGARRVPGVEALRAPRIVALEKPQRIKNAVPLLVGPGLRGGRWPEAHVERDGERCYCGRGWVLPAQTARRRQLLGAGPPSPFISLIALRDSFAAGSWRNAIFPWKVNSGQLRPQGVPDELPQNRAGTHQRQR